jgi:hypothetical protein
MRGEGKADLAVCRGLQKEFGEGRRDPDVYSAGQ